MACEERLFPLLATFKCVVCPPSPFVREDCHVGRETEPVDERRGTVHQKSRVGGGSHLGPATGHLMRKSIGHNDFLRVLEGGGNHSPREGRRI